MDILVFVAIEVLSAIAGGLAFKSFDYAKWVALYITMFGFNTGIFFYPILEQVVGAEGIANMIMFDIPNNLLIFILFPMLFLYVKAKTGTEATEIEPPDESKSVPLDKIKSPVLRSTSTTPAIPSPCVSPSVTQSKNLLGSASSSKASMGGSNGSCSSSTAVSDVQVKMPVPIPAPTSPESCKKRKHKGKGSNASASSDEGSSSSSAKNEESTRNVIEANLESIFERMDDEIIDIVPVGPEAGASRPMTDSVTLPYYVSPSMKKKEIALKILKSIFMNGPFIAIAVSLICFGAGLKLPTWIDNLLEKISRTLTFLGMALMGMLLDLHPRLVLQNIKWVGLTMLARYGVGAVVAVFDYFVVFPHVSPATRVIALLGPFMPSPIMASVFVIDNGYDPFLTSLVVNTFTIISFFIVWILFTFVDFGDDSSSSSSSSSLMSVSSSFLFANETSASSF